MDDIISLIHQLRRKTVQWRDYPVRREEREINNKADDDEIEKGILQETLTEVNNLIEYLQAEKVSVEKKLDKKSENTGNVEQTGPLQGVSKQCATRSRSSESLDDDSDHWTETTTPSDEEGSIHAVPGAEQNILEARNDTESSMNELADETHESAEEGMTAETKSPENVSETIDEKLNSALICIAGDGKSSEIARSTAEDLQHMENASEVDETQDTKATDAAEESESAMNEVAVDENQVRAVEGITSQRHSFESDSGKDGIVAKVEALEDEMDSRDKHGVKADDIVDDTVPKVDESNDKVNSMQMEIISQLVLSPDEHASMRMDGTKPEFFDAEDDGLGQDVDTRSLAAAMTIQSAWAKHCDNRHGLVEDAVDEDLDAASRKSNTMRLQALVRGWLDRERYNKQRHAANIIQAVVRSRILSSTNVDQEDKPRPTSNIPTSMDEQADNEKLNHVESESMTSYERKVLAIANDMRRRRASTRRTDKTDSKPVPAQVEFQSTERDDAMLLDLSNEPEMDNAAMAALVIQQAWRCHSARRSYSMLRAALTHLQAISRGRHARRNWMKQVMVVRLLQRSARSYDLYRDQAASRIQKRARDYLANRREKEGTRGCAPLVVLHPYAAEALSRNPEHFSDTPSGTETVHHEPDLNAQALPLQPSLLPSSYIDPSNSVAKRTTNRRFKRRLGLSRFWRRVAKEAVQNADHDDPSPEANDKDFRDDTIGHSNPTDFAKVTVTDKSLFDSQDSLNDVPRPVRTVRWNLVEDRDDASPQTSEVEAASPVFGSNPGHDLLEEGYSPLLVTNDVVMTQVHHGSGDRNTSSNDDDALRPLDELHAEFMEHGANK